MNSTVPSLRILKVKSASWDSVLWLVNCTLSHNWGCFPNERWLWGTHSQKKQDSPGCWESPARDPEQWGLAPHSAHWARRACAMEEEKLNPIQRSRCRQRWSLLNNFPSLSTKSCIRPGETGQPDLTSSACFQPELHALCSGENDCRPGPCCSGKPPERLPWPSGRWAGRCLASLL